LANLGKQCSRKQFELIEKKPNVPYNIWTVIMIYNSKSLSPFHESMNMFGD